MENKIARKGLTLAGEIIAKLEDTGDGIRERYYRYLGRMSLLKP